MLQHQKYWEKEIQTALKNKVEHNHIDFKSSLSNNNSRIKEHINAFGNSDVGGCFVFGVNRFKVVGIKDDSDAIVSKIGNLARDTQEPPLQIHTFTLSSEKKELLCVYIFPGNTRPVFIKDRTPLGGDACFKRTGAATIPMSVQEIRNQLAINHESFYDESCLENSQLNHLDFEQLQTIIPQLKGDDPSNSSNIAILADNQIACGLHDNAKTTVAGWLIFSKNPQEHRHFRNAFIEFQLFRGTTREVQLKNQKIMGSLPQQIELAITLLMQHVWTMPSIKGTKREDIPAYSVEILREIITNSVVHRDYSKMHQPVKIALFSDRLEIENPGGLMPGLTPLNLIHKREWRNPLIAQLMRKYGFGEMDGQGIDRIYAATHMIHIPAPLIIDSKNTLKIVLSGPKQYKDFSPIEKRLTVLVTLMIEGYIDNERIRNVFGISAEKATTLIKSLIEEHIIVKSSQSRKYARYIFSDEYGAKIFE